MPGQNDTDTSLITSSLLQSLCSNALLHPEQERTLINKMHDSIKSSCCYFALGNELFSWQPGQNILPELVETAPSKITAITKVSTSQEDKHDIFYSCVDGSIRKIGASRVVASLCHMVSGLIQLPWISQPVENWPPFWRRYASSLPHQLVCITWEDGQVKACNLHGDILVSMEGKCGRPSQAVMEHDIVWNLGGRIYRGFSGKQAFPLVRSHKLKLLRYGNSFVVAVRDASQPGGSRLLSSNNQPVLSWDPEHFGEDCVLGIYLHQSRKALLIITAEPVEEHAETVTYTGYSRYLTRRPGDSEFPEECFKVVGPAPTERILSDCVNPWYSHIE